METYAFLGTSLATPPLIKRGLSLFGSRLLVLGRGACFLVNFAPSMLDAIVSRAKD